MSAQSYTYLPTLKEANHWVYEYNAGMGFTGTTEYHIEGDTLVMGQSYKLVKNFSGTYQYAFRENTAEKKVYAINLSNPGQGENLHLNYNVKAGDTVAYDPLTIVSEIDTLFLYGRNRRVIWYNPWSFALGGLIEGIGSRAFGLTATGPFPSGASLINFSELETSPTSVPEAGGGKQFLVYPNPGSSQTPAYILVQVPVQNRIYTYKLFDINGQLCRSGIMLSDIPARVEMDNLESGIYHLFIQKDGVRGEWHRIIWMD